MFHENGSFSYPSESTKPYHRYMGVEEFYTIFWVFQLCTQFTTTKTHFSEVPSSSYGQAESIAIIIFTLGIMVFRFNVLSRQNCVFFETYMYSGVISLKNYAILPRLALVKLKKSYGFPSTDIFIISG